MKNNLGVTLKDWVFTPGDPKPNASGMVGITVYVPDLFVSASLPVTIEMAVQVTGASKTADIKSNGSGFHYSSFSVKRV